jgi:hypothetical protein
MNKPRASGLFEADARPTPYELEQAWWQLFQTLEDFAREPTQPNREELRVWRRYYAELLQLDRESLPRFG